MAFPEDGRKIDSAELAREMQLKSAESRKRNRAMRKAFKEILNEEFDKKVKVNGKDDREITRKEAVSLRLMQMLLDPHTRENDFLKALEFARDTIGEKPIDRLAIAEVDQEVVDEIERMVEEDDEGAGD